MQKMKPGVEKELAPRSRAKQARSMESVQRVLDAADAILRRDGPAAVTTPAIAAESGVSVGALYRYFPNKEAIILALYEERLAKIRAFVARSFQDMAEGGQGGEPGGWRAYVRTWVHDLRAEEERIGFDISLYDAIDHFPRLADTSQEHVNQSCDLLVVLLKNLGSDWPEEALFDLAVHVFYTNAAAWRYSVHAGAPLAQGTARLAESLIALIAPALEGSPPPPPYAARRGS